MSFSGFSFIFWRVLEILTLIPTLGMLAYFVDIFNDQNALTPKRILVLFIVSVLGAAWALGTLFLYSRAKHSGKFVAFIDLCFVGAFVYAVYALRDITKADCSHFERDNWSASAAGFSASGPGFKVNTNKDCAMQKASFAFGIMNCIMFFITFLLALLVHRHHDSRDRVVVKETRHYSRHGHRGHRSRSPRHSHHSSRRSSHYV